MNVTMMPGITWDTSYENFKSHSPDHSRLIDFDQSATGTGRAYIVWICLNKLPQIMAPFLASPHPGDREQNTDADKWTELKGYAENGQGIIPPQGKLCGKRLGITLGLDWFQHAVTHGMNEIPVVVNKTDGTFLKTMHGCRIHPMSP